MIKTVYDSHHSTMSDVTLHEHLTLVLLLIWLMVNMLILG